MGPMNGLAFMLACAAFVGTCALAGRVAALARAAEPGPFAIASFSLQATRAVPSGSGAGYGFENAFDPYSQAAGHPVALTSTVRFEGEGVGSVVGPVRDPKNLVIELPAGVTADPAAYQRCPLAEVLARHERCPAASQVGMFAVGAAGRLTLGPIVNAVPAPGEPAELGFETATGTLVFAARVVRTATGYGLQLSGTIPIQGVLTVEATLWGVPGEALHDSERGLECDGQEGKQLTCVGGGETGRREAAPFLTMGADCAGGPQAAVAYADSWEEPGQWKQAQSMLPAMTGCNLLAFGPELKLQAETVLAEAPTGVAVDVEPGQERAGESGEGFGAPPLNSASVDLPAGLSINPAAGDGPRACPASGPEGFDMPTGLNGEGLPLTPAEVGPGETEGPDGLKRLSAGHCLEDTTIGKAEAVSPLLSGALTGSVYLAQPGCGGEGLAPCTNADAAAGDLYRMYVELEGSGEGSEGVHVKLAGRIEADPTTGQLTVKIDEAPQLPLRRLTLKLNGGPRALLANPPTCGPATTSTDLVPWSAPGITPEGLFAPGTPDATPSSYYEVTGCATPPRLKPGFVAGTTVAQAGAFSPFTLTVTREDREQYLSGLQVHLPAGVLGMIGSVPLCGEPQAAAGECPAASRIGSSLVQAGAGSAPLALDGDVYLTGPHGGSPYGLAIVTHAQVGPFDLGRVTIGARIDVDPHTGALTITSDPLPQILLGIPLRLRRITLNLDRPGFMFNPTDCSAKAVTGTIVGTEGARAAVASPFAASACKGLPFKPRIVLSTSAHADRRRGARLAVMLTQPAGQANIAKLDLQLPKRLAVKGSALEHSCPQAQFSKNPASCPAGSIVGYATARTPLLSTPLAGPAMFVAHPGRRLPGLEIVLQGQGVQLFLAGATTVTRKGYVTARFDTMPDVPIARFQLVLPQGPHAALAPNGPLCKRAAHKRHARVPRRVLMPTRIVGQNGAVVSRSVRVGVIGCSAGGKGRARRG